jgi:hypothetical protein
MRSTQVALTERQQERITVEGQAFLDMLGGLREGATVNEAGARLAQCVQAVLEHATVSESGKIGGPKATLKLVLEVAPNEANVEDFVTVAEKIEAKRPEDRSHVMYVGRGGTLHTHDPRRGLFSVRPRTEATAVSGGASVEFVIPEQRTDGPDELDAEAEHTDTTGEA